MFTQLKPLLGGLTLFITAAALPEDKIRLTVTPRPDRKKGDDDDDDGKVPSALNRPLVITGTAEELDADLASTLEKYVAIRTDAAGALEALEKEFEEAKREKQKAIADEKKQAGDARGKTKTPPPPPAPKIDKAEEARKRIEALMAGKKEPTPPAAGEQPAVIAEQ